MLPTVLVAALNFVIYTTHTHSGTTTLVTCVVRWLTLPLHVGVWVLTTSCTDTCVPLGCRVHLVRGASPADSLAQVVGHGSLSAGAVARAGALAATPTAPPTCRPGYASCGAFLVKCNLVVALILQVAWATPHPACLACACVVCIGSTALPLMTHPLALAATNFRLPPASSIRYLLHVCVCVSGACPVGGLCVSARCMARPSSCARICPGVCVCWECQALTCGSAGWLCWKRMRSEQAKHTASTCMCFVCAAMCPCSLWSRGHSCSIQNPPVYSYTSTCFMKLWLPRITPLCARHTPVRASHPQRPSCARTCCTVHADAGLHSAWGRTHLVCTAAVAAGAHALPINTAWHGLVECACGCSRSQSTACLVHGLPPCGDVPGQVGLLLAERTWAAASPEPAPIGGRALGSNWWLLLPVLVCCGVFFDSSRAVVLSGRRV